MVLQIIRGNRVFDARRGDKRERPLLRCGAQWIENVLDYQESIVVAAVTQ
jgi:hypothetical protein